MNRTRNHLRPLFQFRLHLFRIIACRTIQIRNGLNRDLGKQNKKKSNRNTKFCLLGSIIVEMGVDEVEDESELNDEDLDSSLRLYCRLTAAYNSRAGKACESFGSKSLEKSKPKPKSKHALSSFKSSSVTSTSGVASMLLQRRWRKRRSCLILSFCHSMSRWMSGDHESCLDRSLGCCFELVILHSSAVDGGGTFC